MTSTTVSSTLPSSCNLVSYEPWFSPSPGTYVSYFNEGPQVAATPSQLNLSSSMNNLSSSYPFVHGVEITKQSQYDAGLVKIWSGLPGHESLLTWYGEKGPSINTPFYDDESAYLTDAKSITTNNPKLPILLFPLQSIANGKTGTVRYKTKKPAKISYRTDQDIESVIMDGVIEPLSVRLQPSFYSSDVPIDPHSIRGSFGQGNSDVNGASDQVLTVDYFDSAAKHSRFIREQLPFIDLETSVSESLRNVPGLSSVIFSVPSKPYTDARYVRNTVDSQDDGDSVLTAALSLMTGSTENYIRFDRRSATCGWDYDNDAAVGTDSLAFGGMTY